MSIPLSGSTPKPFLHKHSGFSSLTCPLPYPNLAQEADKLELPLVNAHGERLPNGLYFLRIETLESSETCRFLVLR